MTDLYLLAVNLTRRCNLSCPHCYLDAGARRTATADELTTAEVQGVLAELASGSAHTMVVLTGGEPLLRRDLEAIVAFGAEHHLPMVVGTNGTLLTERRVRSLKQAGALGLGISLDSLDAARHDRFRGAPGSWAKTLAGIEACRRHDLSFQLHFSVTAANAGELSAMIDFARAAGARALNVFFLVCTGRGQSMTDLAPARYEQMLVDIIEAQRQCHDLIIRPRCAPHFKRIAHERRPASPLNRIGGSEGDGCIAGTHYCRITPQGEVTPCPYIPRSEGSIRKERLLAIWEQAEGFKRLRAPALQGRCGACEYRQLCGGCRARALAAGGDLLASDPLCAYEPRGAPLIEVLAGRKEAEIAWSNEAACRLARVPSFLRALVKKRAEAFAAERGERLVTAEHLSLLVAQRFGADAPLRRAVGEERMP